MLKSLSDGRFARIDVRRASSWQKQFAGDMCRYVKSFRTVEKLRDEEWWQATMGPLRPRMQRAHAASLPPEKATDLTMQVRFVSEKGLSGLWVCQACVSHHDHPFSYFRLLVIAD